jgi:hypothetical protein
MSSTVSGSIGLAVNLSAKVAAVTNLLTAYPIPVQPAAAGVSYSAGTAANQANKIYAFSGTATAATVDLDLTAAVCVDGSVGFSHVRELIIYNDSLTQTLTAGVGTNPFTPFFTGTTPAEVIEPGSVFRKAKPLGTNGWVVDSTHKVVRVDPGANTIAYRMIVVGD